MEKIKYNKVKLEAAEHGWILTVSGKTPICFFRWENVVKELEKLLTSKGDVGDK